LSFRRIAVCYFCTFSRPIVQISVLSTACRNCIFFDSSSGHSRLSVTSTLVFFDSYAPQLFLESRNFPYFDPIRLSRPFPQFPKLRTFQVCFHLMTALPDPTGGQPISGFLIIVEIIWIVLPSNSLFSLLKEMS